MNTPRVLFGALAGPLVLGPLVLMMAGTLVAASPDRELEADYFSIDLGQLVARSESAETVSESALIRASFGQIDGSPHVVVPPGSEAYVVLAGTHHEQYRGYRIVGCKPSGQPIKGDVYILKSDQQDTERFSLLRIPFSVDSNPANQVDQQAFLSARGNSVLRLWSDGVAGSAIYRHIATSSLKQIGQSATPTRSRLRFVRRDDVTDTIRMSSGGRAVSENLQLDAQLQLDEQDRSQWVALSEIDGIRVRPIDWSQWLSDEPTSLDPLTKIVPHDQYVVLLPTFTALTNLLDEGDQLVRSVSHWFEPAARRTDVMRFYQTQLGLPLNQLTRQLGGTLIEDIAVTGSDPYFRTGTDVAVLMKSQQPTLLHSAIIAQVTAASAGFDSVQRTTHTVGKSTFHFWSTPRRDFSSAVALIGETVVVANSANQLKRIGQTADGKLDSMHQLDEYRFFRQRYRLSSADESALVILTDAAIRKWCGPRWRIAASRRTRARVSIAEATAEHADQIVAGDVEQLTAIEAPAGASGMGEMWLTEKGVHSDRFGSLNFQTPIAEMEFTHVTQSEKELYDRWRNGYERRWSQVFDPIALKLSLTDHSLHADLTVIPLVVQSDYRWLRDLSGNTRLRSNAGDPHEEAVAQWTLAVDMDSDLIRSIRGIVTSNAGVAGNQAVDWLDGAISIYFDKEEQWIERLESIDRWQRDNDQAMRGLPIGVYLPSKNSFGLVAFVTSVRGILENASPNLIRWETIEHNDLKYVRGTMVNDRAFGDPEQTPQLYYATTPDGLTLSFNERVIQRAIDRHVRRRDQPRTKEPQVTDEVGQPDVPADETERDVSPSMVRRPQLIVEATGEAAELLSLIDYRSGALRMQRLAWSNIPILNDLRHRFPDHDPLTVYEKLFGQQLIEPTGGTYRWSDRLQTFVSSEQGFRLEPKYGPPLPPAFKSSDQLATTLSFQDGGLRATMQIERGDSEGQESSKQRRRR